MDPRALELGQQVFGPSRKRDEGLSRPPEGVVLSTPVYYLPDTTDVEIRLRVLCCLAPYGTSEDISPTAWASWAITYIVTCFEELRDIIMKANGRECKFVPFPADFVTACDALIEAGNMYEEGQSTVYDDAVGRLPPLIGFPDIDINRNTYPLDVVASNTPPVLYGFCGLVVFLAGKNINDRNVTSITERRPQNIINSFRIPEAAQYFLKGAGRMGTQAHQFVNLAWSTHTAARRAIIETVARFDTDRSQSQKAVYIVTQLLEHSGMQPGFFIHGFLQARPEVCGYACIRPALNAYLASVREVASAPSYLQPYYKLYYGQATRAFHRNSIMPLAACAIAHARQTMPSMANFVLGEGATAVITRFDAEAASKGHPLLQDPGSVDKDPIPEE